MVDVLNAFWQTLVGSSVWSCDLLTVSFGGSSYGFLKCSDFFNFLTYALIVAGVVWFATLSIHLFTDLWEVR